MNHAFVLIGAELPSRFLKSLGIRLENEWEGSPLRAAGLLLAALVALWFAGTSLGGDIPFNTALFPGTAAIAWVMAAVGIAALVTTGVRGDRWSWLALSFLAWYSIYGIKAGAGAESEFWPYRNWGGGTRRFPCWIDPGPSSTPFSTPAL